ncbi:hypothetical protein D3C76_1477410 [compost metagenome]
MLRVFAQLGQGRALRRLGVAGQAQHEGFKGFAGGLSTGFGALAVDRLANLIEAGKGFGLSRQPQQGKTANGQVITQTHGGFLSW